MAPASTRHHRPPPGIRLFRTIGVTGASLSSYRSLVLLLTFFAYACYHASRKPTSIVKSVLFSSRHSKRGGGAGGGLTDSLLPWPLGPVFVLDSTFLNGWAPFDGRDGTAKLGEADVAFLAAYSLGMYGAGHLGDRLNLRVFLATGMILSGAAVALFGVGYFMNVHVLWFYLLAQLLAGLLQSGGWPSVVAVVGNWFGGKKRGLIMGVWNAHTSVGNIGGSLLAAAVLQYGWGWSFVLPGMLIAFGGFMVLLFLPAYPEDAGFSPSQFKRAADEEVGRGRRGGSSEDSKEAIGIMKAFMIPGVIPFALCLFFSKLVAYTFLYWLPFYLSQTEIGGRHLSVKSAGNLSTLFDMGGIVGGILAGYISDQLNARATTAAIFIYLAIPSLYVYSVYGGISESVNIILMMVSGLFVNGPYALITTAVSADLGTHESLKGDSRALATVTAIIDGTGSVGAALGPFITGFLSRNGWGLVFEMLMVGAFIAGVMLTALVRVEILQIIQRHRRNTVEGSSSVPLLREDS